MSIVSQLFSGFNSFMMNVLFWFVILAVAAFFIFRWFSKKNIYKYTFIEVHKNGSFFVKKAKIIKNKRGLRKFCLREYEDPQYYMSAEVEPNGFYNGKPVRFYTWDGRGNITFIKGFDINKEEYLKTALTTVERSEAVDAQMESIERSNPITKQQKWLITAAIIMCVFAGIVVIMTGKYFFENAQSFMQGSNNMVEVSGQLKDTAEIIKENNVIMRNFVTAYAKVNDVNVSMELGTN